MSETASPDRFAKGCRKVQVKKLFFVFADKHARAWRKHINASQVDLRESE
ncbi:type IV toxin-antitoxin system AbiEi family antitoxin domain-containing protein [Ensifer sp. IC3342]|nr:type IV toxin-antitoxin system AbiEi family antitoxin domain-containing protein [Ensifer sp. BRP08]MCA1449704.1 type IV toxin-antitoxin system AbiEi family antitoxin domain-containing protein [Ensifer sp. IC3342]